MNYDKNDLFWKNVAELPHNPYLMRNPISGFSCLFLHVVAQSSFSESDYPISFGTMASLLRMNDASATIRTLDISDREKPVFLGFNLICFYPMAATLRNILKLASIIKKSSPETKICLFNSEQHQHEMIFCSPQAVELAQSVMQECPYVDFILIGQAELSFIRLCAMLASGNSHYEELPITVYRVRESASISEGPLEPVDFNHLPFPSRDFLEANVPPSCLNTNSIRIQSSRGCTSRCSYCAESHVNMIRSGKKQSWLGRDMVTFVDEIEFLAKHFHVFFFNVIDSSFEDPGITGMNRMKRFCDEIHRRSILASFKIHLRAETIDKLTTGFLKNLKDAGVDIIVSGIESGVDRELHLYCSKTNAEKSLHSIRKIDASGSFFTILGHMMFSPLLQLDDLTAKMEFLNKIHRAWDFLNISNNILIFRGTVLHRDIEARGLCLEYDPLSTIVPYRYEDPRVEYVSDRIGDIKTLCPEIMTLNSLFYDALNIGGRFYNKANQHLWEHEAQFERFTEDLHGILERTADVYTDFFVDTVDHARHGRSPGSARSCFSKWFSGIIPKVIEETQMVMHDFLSTFKRNGLSTDRLYLKTWISMINQRNTASGRV